jgi:asparagine synthase (glutamine-hydrolysing)
MDETMRDGSLAADIGLNGSTVAALWSAFRNDVPGLYWTRIWAVYVLIRWCHRHRVLA